ADDEAGAENAAVIEDVAVLISRAFPRHDARERWQLEVRHPPLGAREERDADGGDAAVAPGLMAGPLDRVVEVDCILRGIEQRLPRRLAGAALVDAHATIAARHPPFRVHGLPVHVGIGLLFQIGWRDPQLVLLVDAHVDQHGKMPVAIGPQHVGLELGAIPHRDVDVLLDLHLVARFGRFGPFAARDLLLHGTSTLSESKACGYAGTGRTHQVEPHTSRAVSTTRRSLASSPSSSMALPPMPLENPHCGLSASCSSGACLLASSMRRLSSSFDSSLPLLVVTRPRTATLPLGRKRSGSKPPARALSYSRK